MKTTTNNTPEGLMVKIFELRTKSTNELLSYHLTEQGARKEFINMKEDGEDMSNIIGCENFMLQSKHNADMNEVFASLASR